MTYFLSRVCKAIWLMQKNFPSHAGKCKNLIPKMPDMNSWFRRQLMRKTVERPTHRWLLKVNGVTHREPIWYEWVTSICTHNGKYRNMDDWSTSQYSNKLINSSKELSRNGISNKQEYKNWFAFEFKFQYCLSLLIIQIYVANKGLYKEFFLKEKFGFLRHNTAPEQLVNCQGSSVKYGQSHTYIDGS